VQACSAASRELCYGCTVSSRRGLLGTRMGPILRLAAVGLSVSPLLAPVPARPSVAGSVDAPVIVAAGDIACDPTDPDFNGGLGVGTHCRQMAVSDTFAAIGPTEVLTLGDNQYLNGGYSKYLASYDPSWGRYLDVTYPTPGNHDYFRPGADGYFRYFGERAGSSDHSYYSFDLGGWHLVALDSNCDHVDCGRTGSEYAWLQQDLADDHAQCTLAYWHHPRFSSGPHGDTTTVGSWWKLLYGAGADVVLNGHDHLYERFAPMNPSGALDTDRGITEFIVGTGGQSLYSIDQLHANSEIVRNQTFGALELKLQRSSYTWSFVRAAGKPLTDTGTAGCH
jgi:calcineurin-like phosphoesterase family protein